MKFFNSICLLLPSFFGISCAGVGFEKAWNESVNGYRSGKIKDPVAGPWVGTWKTDTNGHEGKLRCLVSRSQQKEGSYDFRYYATWFKIFRSGYQVSFDVTEEANGIRLVLGNKDLGIFGDFKHSGTISGPQFNATYSNHRGEVGRFQMSRPE